MKWNDKSIKDKMNTYSSNYNSDVFEAVLLGLPKKEKERKPILWIWLGIAAFAIFSVVLWKINNTGQNIPNQSTVEVIESSKFANKTDIKKELSTKSKTSILPSKSKLNSRQITSKSELAFTKEKEELSNSNTSGSDQNENINLFTSQNAIDRAINNSGISPDLMSKEPELQVRPMEKLENLQILIPSLNTKFDKIFTTEERNINEPIGCPFDDIKTRRPIFFELYFSHDMPMRSLGPNSNESQTDYINLRNETESPIYSYHFGARFSSYIFRDITLRLGLDYASYQEKFEVTELESTREVIVRDADGNIISSTTEIGTRDVRNYNRIKSFNIPISLGISRKVGPINITAHGGVSMDLISSHSGIIIEPGPMPNAVTYSSGSSSQLDVFKNDLGLSVIGSVGIQVPLKNNFSFGIEPNFKYILNPVNVASYPIEQRIFTVGLLTGLQYKF